MNQRTMPLIFAALLALLGACNRTPSETAAEVKTGTPTRFRTSFSEIPTSLDPIKANSAYSGAIITNVYDTLYRYQLFANPYVLRPNLASAMPEFSADGKIVRIRLRTDVYFQDSTIFPGGKGRQVQAHDVVYSLKRHFVPANFSDGAWLWSDAIVGVADWVKAGADMAKEIEGLRAIAPDQIEIQLTQPMPMLTSTLANAYSAIVPEEAVRQFGADLARKAVGSGPFLLSSFDGAKALLTRNPKFRAEPFVLADEGFEQGKHGRSMLQEYAGQPTPFVDEIEINFLNEPATVQLAFSGKSLDAVTVNAPMLEQFFVSRSPLQLRPQFESLNFREYEELGSVFVSFNMLDAELGASPDPAVDARHRALRCAIAEAYNWQERSEKIYQGTAMLYRGVIPPNVEGFEAKNAAPIFDLASAKARLAAAGYNSANLPTLKFGSTSGSEQRRAFELFRSQMLDLGFTQTQIEWQSFPSFGAYIEAVNRGEVMLMDMGWQFDAPDGENILQLYYGPYKAPQVNNANYQNALFDRAFERIRGMPVGPERSEIMQQMNQQLIDECVVISGATRRSISVWHHPWRVWPDNASMAGNTFRYVFRTGSEPSKAALP